MLNSDAAVNTHLLLGEEKLSRYAIITDSPWIFDEGVKIFEETPTVTRGRYGVKVAVGEYKGLQLSIVQYGVGSSEALALVEELFRSGVRVVVKLGFGVYTMTEKPPARIAIGAVRLDRMSETMAPPEMPAIPNYELLTQLALSFNVESIPHEEDLVVSVGYPISQLENGLLPSWWRKMGINVVDLDTATLYVASYFRRLKTVSVVIPAIPSSDVFEKRVWTAYIPSRGEAERYREIIGTVYESMYHMKEKAWIESTTKKLEKRQ